MPIFSSDKETKEQESTAVADDSSSTGRVDNTRQNVIVAPHITEKASKLTNDNVYAFEVAADANKPQIKQAVQDIYGVKPEKVRTVKLPKKRVQARRGKPGTKGGLKKAYVKLKEGDSIELM